MSSVLVAIAAAVAVAFFFISRASRLGPAERTDTYRNAAALRGWQAERDGSEYRYSGRTEGVPWTARMSKALIWQTTAVTYEQGVLMIWPNFGEGIAAIETSDVPKAMLNLAMRPIAQLLGASSQDAELLVGASEEVPGPPGYLLRASDPARMRAWLANGAAEVLESEAGWLADRKNGQQLIVAVLWKHGLQLVTPKGDLDQVARVARVGGRLAKGI